MAEISIGFKKITVDDKKAELLKKLIKESSVEEPSEQKEENVQQND